VRVVRRDAMPGCDYSPHMPRLGAPQAPHGPAGSADEEEREDPATANTENSFSTCRLPHSLQAAWVLAEITIFSNLAPQSRHLYSNIGIRGFTQTISKPDVGFNCVSSGRDRVQWRSGSADPTVGHRRYNGPPRL
jgi:hypothetical protein